MISQDTIRKELEFYEAAKQALSVRLRHLPRGSIYYKQEHGRKRPYVRINGKEMYLSVKHKATICGLLNRAEIEKSLEMICCNQQALGDLLEIYHDLSEIMPKGFAFPEGKLSKYQIAEITDRWEKERKIDRLPAELFMEEEGERKPRKFKTSDGTYVKSKSELVIYECLKLRGIPFLYEQSREINGRLRYPDFTILRQSDGATILWEHFGMMELEWYEREAQAKLFNYACEGFWPFKNLITTFEFRDGELDVAEIERILKMMLLI